jgi:hypothetical protein
MNYDVDIHSEQAYLYLLIYLLIRITFYVLFASNRIYRN